MAIRRWRSADTHVETDKPRGFDGYDLRLGDLMRGERATMGKSLLDVEREIRIRATYIAAIENADPDAFDTPGFIPGYVRSYARYLGMDPDDAFAAFCAECGFSVAHGMSAGASSNRKPAPRTKRATGRGADPLISPATPFLPARESLLSRVEPGALGSALVLLTLIAGIGYGGWSVINEIQRVQVAPVENTPDVLTDLDPLDGVAATAGLADDPLRGGVTLAGVDAFEGNDGDGLERLYRPEALDMPVMVARDAPISTLDPSEIGTFSASLPDIPRTDRSAIETAIASAVSGEEPATPPKVVADPPPGVRIVAVRPAWVRVSDAGGAVVFEGILNGGDTYDVPATEEPPALRVGESGAIYFQVAGQHYGPVGPKGSVTSGLALDAEALTGRYEVADISDDRDLESYVASLEQGVASE
ncbi:helix-turn-helix domain-containing protein [Roseovarius amoyensis]|uniref:helix-turn-helix domain-containing protein n=1 Tax=Roseovarius amoyensis TaxID=2211448 RepID=UPI000DBE824B|nr:helix-turn-helix domain-containing protein [Roseovarius amoyensis]